MRFIGPRGLAFSLSLGVLSGLAPVGRVAYAADTQAEQLYRAGQKAVAAQDWAGACTDFRESEAREHAPGTVLNLAVCEEKLGQLVQAKAHFEIAAKEFRRRDPRIGYATRLAAAIDLRIPRLTMHLAPALPPDASLERDGAAVDLSPLRQAGAAGQTVALDPGVHVLVVRAAGHADAHLDVKLAEGAREEITLAAGPLTDTGAGAALAPTPAPPPSSALAPVAPSAFTTTSPAGGAAAAAPSADGGSSLRGLGIAATAVGGAGLAFGFIAGAITLSKKSSADSNCSSTTCNAAGAAAESSGQTWSAVSTAGVVAGAAILATGITLLLVAPRDGDRSAGAAAGASGVHGVRLTRVGLVPSLGGPGGTGTGASLGLAGTF